MVSHAAPVSPAEPSALLPPPVTQTVPSAPPAMTAPAFPGHRQSPRIARSEDPNYVPMVDKATNLKRRKLEGAGKKVAAATVPVCAPHDKRGRPSGTLPAELVELAKDAANPLAIEDTLDLAAACGVDEVELLLEAPAMTSQTTPWCVITRSAPCSLRFTLPVCKLTLFYLYMLKYLVVSEFASPLNSLFFLSGCWNGYGNGC